MTVTRVRVCDLDERLPVHVNVATTFTAPAVLNSAAPELRVAVAAPVPAQEADSVFVVVS